MDHCRLKEVRKMLVELSSKTLAWEYMSEQTRNELLGSLKADITEIIHIIDEGIKEYEEIENALGDIAGRINGLRDR